MFQDEAHKTDVRIATDIVHEAGGSSSHAWAQVSTDFQQHIDNLQRISQLRERVREVVDEAEFYENLVTWNTLSGEEEDPSRATMRQEAEKLRKKAEEMVKLI